MSADSKTLYCTHAGTHELSVIDIPAMLARIGPDSADRLSLLHGIRRRIPLPGKGPRALAVAGAKVFVAEYFTRTIALVMDGVAKPFAAAPPPPATPEFRGEMLFHDAGLCFEHWQSCSSCHPGGRADGLNWDLMNDGIGNPKNTRSLLNSHRTGTVMWTGVRPLGFVRGALRQVKLPVTAPAAVARGRKLFQSAGCVACHPPPLYTDNALHDVGTHGPADFNNGVPQREFQTPSLIEVWRTAPYLHDGRYATLEEAIRGNPGAAALKDLAAFLRSL